MYEYLFLQLLIYGIGNSPEPPPSIVIYHIRFKFIFYISVFYLAKSEVLHTQKS